jgi:hypothetical protein
MLCVPAIEKLVMKTAVPVPSSGWTPKAVAPSENTTEPVGVPDAEATTAVSETGAPAWAGLGKADNAVLVEWAFTTSAIAADVLGAEFVSPKYVALTLCVPGLRSAVSKTAALLERCTTPRVVVPS